MSDSNEQLFQIGDVHTLNDTKLECTFVSYQEFDGKKVNFTYSFRPHEDMEREREETKVPDVAEGQEA